MKNVGSHTGIITVRVPGPFLIREAILIREPFLIKATILIMGAILLE